MDWEKEDAEWLEYAVTRPAASGDLFFQGRIRTRRIFLRNDGTTTLRNPGAGAVEALECVLTLDGEADGLRISEAASVQIERKAPFPLLRQERSLRKGDGFSHRSLDCRNGKPRLSVLSTGREPTRTVEFSRWPVYTEAMLFAYLRAVPQRAGYREDIWLFDGGPEGRPREEPVFASIVVRERASGVRDMDTWYVTVDRDRGRRSEFWIASAGLHPIVAANLVDGTTWSLLGISRKKLPSR